MCMVPPLFPSPCIEATVPDTEDLLKELSIKCKSQGVDVLSVEYLKEKFDLKLNNIFVLNEILELITPS